MADLVKVVNTIVVDALDKAADEAEAEMKAIVGKHSRSGAALGAIHTEKPAEYTRFVGGTGGGDGVMHLYYLDQGNGGRGRVITAKHKRKTGGPGALGEWPDGIPGYGWRQSVHGYDGIGFIKDIASRFGGG